MAEKAVNPLLPGKLDMSPEEEQEQRWELTEANEASLLELQERKANLASKRDELALESKEKNLGVVEQLNENIQQIISDIADPALVRRVMATVETGKDMNEAVKAAQGIVKLRDDMLDGTYDAGANTAKKRKIELVMGQSGTTTMFGVKIDDG